MNAPHEDGSDDLRPLNTEARIAVMSVEITHIGKTLDRIEQQGAHAVPRTEWEQRNLYVDGRFVDQAERISKVSAETAGEVGALKAEIAGRRAPWWTIVATIGGVFATVVLLFEFVPRILN